ncbi:hypothetical protein J3A64_001862 [Pseudarthrobacter sp. PvP004]|uniref:NACHT domain-containing protein n=1 Tax=Pseudarthrobacter sp. PvP004 TaxID=2817850 RepID=UPI001AE1C995|nr:hypothetical protein [Pseudarthrobacter sp. PvP004]MBP2266398.1 hypothetical protein [Pseudarthrobacter sp. PvP004]
MVNQGAIGGAAGESGSNHRSIAAALIAAFGLNGKSVPWLGPDAWPERISLETDNEVDDIEVVLSDGSAIHIQAKNSCGLGRDYKKSVEQWVAAETNGTAAVVDRFILLVALASGTLAKLGKALDHKRARTSLTRGENALIEDALLLLTGHHRLDEAAARSLLKKVHVVVLDTSTQGQAVQLGSALLDSSVVAPGNGNAAFAILESSFHDQSRRRAATSDGDWRSILRSAHIPVLSDPKGALAARHQAQDDELTKFRRDLAAQKDMVQFPSTEVHLEPFIRPGCSRALKVRMSQSSQPTETGRARDRDEFSLLDVTRRQGRYLLVGGPGTGKSFSLAQIAANCAANHAAPLPLPLRLRELAKAMQDRPNVQWGPQHLAKHLANGNEVLEDALLAAMAEGFVIYLFDGLDEVPHHRSTVAGWLNNFLAGLPDHTDIVVSSRYPAAADSGLDMPHIELLPPRDLSSLNDDLLVRFSEKVRNAEDRAAWLQNRRAFVESSRRQDPDMWAIPLLAMLMISVLAAHGPASVPRTRSGLLRAALDSSVKRWEMTRIDTIAPGLPREYQAQIVLDTFADIAGVVAGDGEWLTAFEAVERRLQQEWDIPRGAVSDYARAILSFWDLTAAVFITSTEEGRLSARSRLFAEIGVARLLARDFDTMKSWVLANKSDPESFVTLRLLCGLSEEAMEWIGTTAADGEPDLLDVVLDAVDEGAKVSEKTFSMVLDAQMQRLPLMPRSTGSSEFSLRKFLDGPEDPGYRLAVRMAGLPLSSEQSQHLRGLAKSHLEERQKSVLLAVLEISNPQHALSDQAWQLIEAALPPTPDRSRADGYVTPWQDIDVSGIEIVAEHAAENIDSSRGTLASRVLAGSLVGPNTCFDRVRKLLKAKGFHDEVAFLSRGIGGDMFAGLPESFRNTSQPEELMRDSLGEPEACSAADLWHLDAAAAAYASLRVNDMPFGLLYWAAENNPALARQLIRRVVDDSSLATGQVAAQIRAVLADPDASLLLTVPSPRTPKNALLPSVGWEVDAMSAWRSRNDWLGRLAFSLSLAATKISDSTIDEMRKLVSAVTPQARKEFGVITEWHRPGTRWVDEDALCKSGARRVQTIRAWENKDYPTLIRNFQDPDLEIRNKSILVPEWPQELVVLLPAIIPEATSWTCWQCGKLMAQTDTVCPENHPRPDDKVAARLARIPGRGAVTGGA